jgi:hypothetical protein
VKEGVDKGTRRDAWGRLVCPVWCRRPSIRDEGDCGRPGRTKVSSLAKRAAHTAFEHDAQVRRLADRLAGRAASKRGEAEVAMAGGS